MGRVFLINLEGYFYCCKHCRTPFVLGHDIISKNFSCTLGMAYLCDNVVNVTVGKKHNKIMMTGLSTTVDIFCVTCGSIIGWKYVAYGISQKYKEGKFVLERCQLIGPDDTL